MLRKRGKEKQILQPSSPQHRPVVYGSSSVFITPRKSAFLTGKLEKLQQSTAFSFFFFLDLFSHYKFHI